MERNEIKLTETVRIMFWFPAQHDWPCTPADKAGKERTNAGLQVGHGVYQSRHVDASLGGGSTEASTGGWSGSEQDAARAARTGACWERRPDRRDSAKRAMFKVQPMF